MEEMHLNESTLIQLKQDHTIELQHVLAQLADVENDRTKLMQTQLSGRVG